MRMCEAFAELDHRVTLVAKRSCDTVDPYAFYGVANVFSIETIARPKWRGGGVLHLGGTAARLLRAHDVDLVYSRDLLGAAMAAELGMPVVFEVHGVFDRRWQRAVCMRMVRRPSFRGLVPISHAMLRELDRAGMVPAGCPVVVAHSPANEIPGTVAKFEPSTPPRIGYVGSLYVGRGVELVVEVASRMPGCQFEIIGGTDADLARWRAATIPTNVTFRGFEPPARLDSIYRELDVVLMPYPHTGVFGPSNHLDTAKYCSPMKMFEYMASGVPMVASDLPVLGEVLTHERNALIAPSGDAAAWQAAIARLVSDRALRRTLASNALADLREFTPRARARRILAELRLA